LRHKVPKEWKNSTDDSTRRGTEKGVRERAERNIVISGMCRKHLRGMEGAQEMHLLLKG